MKINVEVEAQKGETPGRVWPSLLGCQYQGLLRGSRKV